MVSMQNRLRSFNPDTGKELWNADGIHRYICPSVVAHDGIVYAIGGGHTSLAVKAGGHGDVTKTNESLREKKGSNVSSPVYHDGYLYWGGDGSFVHCQDAATGKFVYSERLTPDAGRLWAIRRSWPMASFTTCRSIMALTSWRRDRNSSCWLTMFLQTTRAGPTPRSRPATDNCFCAPTNTCTASATNSTVRDWRAGGVSPLFSTPEQGQQL